MSFFLSPLLSSFPPVFVWLLRTLLHHPHLPPQVLLAAPGKRSYSLPLQFTTLLLLHSNSYRLSVRTKMSCMISVFI